MAKLTLDNISAGYLSITTYNANNDLIEAALENTLSRDGTGPNTMEANLDMNSYRLTNLPDAVANQEPITLAQAASIASVSTAFSQENVGAALWPRTAAEVSAGVTPTNYYYEPGDVRRYGAKGDGSTDDSTAIHNAILGANGGPVRFQEGLTYRCDTLANTNIGISVDIRGNGAILDGNSTTTSGFVFTNPGSTIAHVRIDGLTFKDIETYAVDCDQGNSPPTIGVDDENITEFLFTNNKITSGASGVHLRCFVDSTTCTNNKITTLASSTIPVCGFFVGGNHDTDDADAAVEQALMRYAVYEGNIIDDLDCTMAANPEAHGILHYGDGATITGNVVRNVRNSSAATGAEGIYTKCRWAVISNNVLRDAGTQEASIDVKGRGRSQTTYTGSYYGYGTVVSNNNLYCSTGEYSGIGINNSDCLVDGNYLEGFGEYAIWTRDENEYNNITIRNNNIAQHRGLYAIYTQHYGVSCDISGNVINELLGTQGTPTVAYGIYILASSNVARVLQGLTIRDNHIVSTGTSASSTVRGIVVTCAEDNLTDVKVSGNFIDIVDDSASEVGIAFTGAGAPDKVVISDNDCLSCAQAFLYSTAMTNIHIKNNQFISPDSATTNIEIEDCNGTFYNLGSGGTSTRVLPASLPGLHYKFLKVANQNMRIDPDGTEVIRGGGAGKYLQLDAAATPSMVELECIDSGTWEVINAYGTISYEA